MLLSLNVTALSSSYMHIRSLQVWHGLKSFFFLQIAFTLNCWLLSLLGCVTYNTERATTFAILVKYTKNFKPLKKNVSIPRTDEKKLHTREFQQKGIDGNMKCKLLQKRTARKTTECSKYLRHIAIEKDIFSELN